MTTPRTSTDEARVDRTQIASRLAELPEQWIPELGKCFNVTLSVAERDEIVKALMGHREHV